MLARFVVTSVPFACNFSHVSETHLYLLVTLEFSCDSHVTLIFLLLETGRRQLAQFRLPFR